MICDAVEALDVSTPTPILLHHRPVKERLLEMFDEAGIHDLPEP